MNMSLDVIFPFVIPLLYESDMALLPNLFQSTFACLTFWSAQGVLILMILHSLFERKGLLLCSTGDPGTPFVLVSAMVGRLFLDACFTLIYLTVVDVFTPSARTTVLPICDSTAELVRGTGIRWLCFDPSPAVACIRYHSDIVLVYLYID